MQWVQRNSSKVQGIEYFTGADISMRTSEWCAYNIVIPAMPTYDDKNDKNIDFIDETDMNNDCSSFKRIYFNFVDNSSSSECIERIISKYKDFCWNDMHPHTEIMLICNKDSEIDEPVRWLNENHILHSICKIDFSDKSIEYLKKIASDAEVSLDDFWGCHVEDDGWIKDNIDKVKTPIFVKICDVSIYSKPGTKFVEIVSIGFDKDILFDKLIC